MKDSERWPIWPFMNMRTLMFWAVDRSRSEGLIYESSADFCRASIKRGDDHHAQFPTARAFAYSNRENPPTKLKGAVENRTVSTGIILGYHDLLEIPGYPGQRYQEVKTGPRELTAIMLGQIDIPFPPSYQAQALKQLLRPLEIEIHFSDGIPDLPYRPSPFEVLVRNAPDMPTDHEDLMGILYSEMRDHAIAEVVLSKERIEHLILTGACSIKPIESVIVAAWYASLFPMRESGERQAEILRSMDLSLIPPLIHAPKKGNGKG